MTNAEPSHFYRLVQFLFDARLLPAEVGSHLLVKINMHVLVFITSVSAYY